MNCPCGSEKTLANCCEPFLSGKSLPRTAEELMRSRYTAYTRGDLVYLKKTSESPSGFDAAAAKKWANQAEWKTLKILSTEAGAAEDSKGKVEFIASYVQEGEEIEHHEVSRFRKNRHGEWRFVDGDAHTHKGGEAHHHHHARPETVAPKVGRNDPCSCGSGKKYKKCCGA